MACMASGSQEVQGRAQGRVLRRGQGLDLAEPPCLPFSMGKDYDCL